MRGPHDSALADKDIAHFSAESKGKVESKRARLVLYDDLKGGLPKQMKVFPITAIPPQVQVILIDPGPVICVAPHSTRTRPFCQ